MTNLTIKLIEDNAFNRGRIEGLNETVSTLTSENTFLREELEKQEKTLKEPSYAAILGTMTKTNQPKESHHASQTEQSKNSENQPKEGPRRRCSNPASSGSLTPPRGDRRCPPVSRGSTLGPGRERPGRHSTPAEQFSGATARFRREFLENPFVLTCAVCDRLWFAGGVSMIGGVSDEKKRETGACALRQCYELADVYKEPVCRTCRDSLLKGAMPRFATVNGYKYPPVPEHLPRLNVVEERGASTPVHEPSAVDVI
ncbi:hypothetical protein HPB47_005613 [Ixodes persulcatus]|uniref:Uncharacterized protein n=1 Tax=Ixodes persulcatus TaxID=34615 RepID=A0AC60PCH4_IXOPE|nr:hypothetical protein HPB47_005613 [Ixodes persulcatus]